MRRIAYASVAMVGLMPVSLHAQWPFKSSAKPETPAATAAPTPAPAAPAAQPGQPTATPAPYASTGLPPAVNPQASPPASGPVPIAPAGSYSPPKPAPAPASSGCACCPSTTRPAAQPNYGSYTPPTGYPGYGSQPSVPITGYPTGPGYGQMGSVMPAGGYVPHGYTAEGEAVAVARSVPGYPATAQPASYQSSNFDQLPVAPPADTSADAVPEKPSWWRRTILRQKTVQPPGADFQGNFSSTPPQNVPYDPKPIISEVPKERPATASPSLGQRMFGWLPFVN